MKEENLEDQLSGRTQRIEKRVGFLLERTTRIAKLSFIKAFRDLEVDITPEQWVIMDTLYLEGNLSQKEIAASSFKNPPTISRILDILEKNGYIKRRQEKTDKRMTLVALTYEGRLIVEKCKNEISRLRALSWQNLNDEEYQQFTKTLDQVFANFSKYLKQ